MPGTFGYEGIVIHKVNQRLETALFRLPSTPYIAKPSLRLDED